MERSSQSEADGSMQQGGEFMQQASGFMMQAIALAIENATSGRGGPFGAVIVKDGRVIATGVNGVTATNDPTAHAEVTAIRGACEALSRFELSGCDVYSSCEPCPMCLAAIYWARCRAVYYGSTAADAAAAGFDDAFLYEEMRKPIPERRLTMVQLLPDAARAGFAAWNGTSAKVMY